MSESTQKKPNIIIVDDDSISRGILASFVSTLGYAAQENATGSSMYKYISHHQPVAVLLDINLPHQCGMQLLSQIRQKFSPEQLPVIIVSVEGSSKMIKQALADGANDYLVKPIKLEKLEKMLNQHIDRDLAFAD